MPAPVCILNGDALARQWPDDLPGDTIVMRECLMEGPVTADSHDAFFAQRQSYLATTYPHAGVDYDTQVQAELDRIGQIPPGNPVELWFDHDLFCQVNCWFVCHQLVTAQRTSAVSWVLPPTDSPSGFAAVPSAKWGKLRPNALPLTPEELTALADLWKAYQRVDLTSLSRIADLLHPTLPHVARAVALHRQRVENDHPRQLLREIIATLPHPTFAGIFREFCRRAPDYGFGDAQVHRLVQEVQGSTR